MKKLSIGAIIQTAATLFLTYLVWNLIIWVAILMIGADVVIHIREKNFVLPNGETDILSLISSLFNLSMDVFPLGELMKNMFGDLLNGSAGVLITVVDFVSDTNGATITSSFQNYSTHIMEDLALLSIARLIFAIYKKFKALFQSVQSCLFKLMLLYATPLWVCASFFTADLLLMLLKMVVPEQRWGLLYVILFVAITGILSVFIAYISKKRVALKLLVVCLEFGFDATRALLAGLWIASMTLAVVSEQALYTIEYTVITFMAISLYFGLEVIEDKIVAQYERSMV